MALLLPHSVFIHIPKTGGSWVRTAIERAGIPVSQLPCMWHLPDGTITTGEREGQKLPPWHNCWHNSFRDIDPGGRYTFSFVRHPVSVYRSYWQYRQRTGWDMTNPIDMHAHSDNFDVFVSKMLERPHSPDWVSLMYKHYLFSGDRRVDFIGVQENLADDLVTALRAAGEDFDEEALRATPPNNVSSAGGNIRINPHTIQRIIDAEHDAVERFKYGAYPVEYAYT